MLPSLVATDLDGTFLDADKRISEQNARAARRCHELGIPFVVATGRPARWLQCLDPIRDAHPQVISSNGGAVFDLAEQRIVESFWVPHEPVLRVARTMREACPEVHFGVEYGIEWGREPGFPLRGDLVEGERVGPLEEVIEGRDFVKLLVVSTERSSDDLARALLHLCDEHLTATWSMGGPIGLLEVSAKGVTKAATLRRLADEMGVDLADAVAFGDMPNDLDMLNAVGHPFAMADCHPLLREAGFPSAGDHRDSGVGRTLEALLPTVI